MLHSKLFLSSFVFALLSTGLIFSGCSLNMTGGPSLFEEETVEDATVEGATEETVTEENDVATPGVAEEKEEGEGDVVAEEAVIENYEGGDFGFRVLDTVCIRQIHGGCVPYDYGRYLGDILGIHFRIPTDWVNTSANEQELTFLPSERENGDADITRLFVWRSSNPKIAEYKAAVSKTIDEGDGKIGEYDVLWSVVEGEFEGKAMKAEWIELVLDEDHPWSNFTFFLITEPQNFVKDQSVIRAAASSILEE